MKRAKNLNLSYSLGFTVGAGAKVGNVIWDGLAFNQGVTNGSTIVAVNGREYSDDELKEAITAAKGGREPIRLLLKEGNRYREVSLAYHQGLRFPHLQRTGSGPALLDRMLAPLP
jgi:predicted metalloprotease with PDZ domain